MLLLVVVYRWCTVGVPLVYDLYWCVAMYHLPPSLSDNHFLCDDVECDGCLVAFATHDELQRHRRLHHGAGMQRWEPRRARPVALEFSAERARRPLRAQRSASPELLSRQGRRAARGPSGPSGPLGPSPLGPPQSNDEPGWRMVDDDVGMLPDDQDAFPAIGAPAAGPSTSWPLLASPAPAPPPQQTTPSKYKALRSVTVKCPCGRKSRIEVVAEVWL